MLAAPTLSISLGDGSLFAGRYVIVRRIGSGGMGAVYEVLHRETKRKRALKILLPVLVSDPDARARFAQEATITAEIESEYLVETFDAGVDAATGFPFIVMELLRGESLGERLAQGRRLTPPQVIEVLRQLASVLEKTHAAGIVHRDLKPDNLFMCARENGTVRIKVFDFGIAKIVQQASKSRNTVNIGTPLYMAPEQIDGGRIDRRADVYSLGHVAYELLTGESYWEDELRRAPSTLVLLKWMEGPMPEAPSVRAQRKGVAVGPTFDAWFTRATARRPENRYGSATELVEALVAVLGLDQAAISAAAPLSVPRLSIPEGLPTRPVAGVPAAAITNDTDAPTRVRASPLEDAPAPVIRAQPLQARPSAPIALIAISAAAAFLAVGALILALGGAFDGGAAPSATGTPPTATPTPTDPVVTAVIVPVPILESAAPALSVAASATASAPRPTKPVRNRPLSDVCRLHPERCR